MKGSTVIVVFICVAAITLLLNVVTVMAACEKGEGYYADPDNSSNYFYCRCMGNTCYALPRTCHPWIWDDTSKKCVEPPPPTKPPPITEPPTTQPPPSTEPPATTIPTPATTNPTPATTNPTPATTNPTPATTNPTPATTNPTPATTNPTPDTTLP